MNMKKQVAVVIGPVLIGFAFTFYAASSSLSWQWQFVGLSIAMFGSAIGLTYVARLEE